ncbi:MAG: ABC-F family ATP-binding cassette domain-containing protein [Chitinophagaceae bacterium]|nr:ABC-F family ATP-binding cassette domain-containing protein [Chitinophagaceae bacterium]
MLAGLENVVFEFGSRVIVKDATWHIQPGERIGLIGYNGTGKSTMLKLLASQYAPSQGTVVKAKNLQIGYLHQDLLSFDTNESILEVAMGAFEKVKQLEREIEQLGIELETDESEEKLILYTDKLGELELAGGYTIHHRSEEVLQGLGFSNSDLQRPYKEYSGGWRMRVLLAKMILQQPDLLLLDEPTNHLDLPSIEWIEKYLMHYNGAVVIVSHDKYFLNRMVTKVVELYQQQLHFYTGNYDYYETEKALRVELQQRAYENQQDYIRQQERFIERFKAKASKAAQAQSVVKRLERLDKIDDVTIERPSLRINFQVDKTPGKVICTLKNLSKSFGNLKIVENTEAEIDRGDKIALIGANGKGKSTVLRIIADRETFDGERIWGHNVDESFYAQHQLEALDLSNTILDEMKTAGSQKTEMELRTLLGCFLFSGDDADKRIKVLSGGEKARVALAKTITSKANFLMLDEPTNHLDLHSVELLIEALNKYEGSLILVSHDRYFISKTANKIWEIEDGQIKAFKGSYDEWIDWKNRMKARDAAMAKPVAAPKKEQEKKEKKVSAPIDVNKQKEDKKLQKRFAEIEVKLADLQQQKAKAEALLADPALFSDKNKFIEAEKNYSRLKLALQQVEAEYEEVFEQIVKSEG